MKITIENSVLPFLISPLTEPRGLEQFCQNLIAYLFEKGKSPCTEEFPDEKIKRQPIDHYLKGICSLTSQYGVYTIELRSQMHFMTDISFKLMIWILNFQKFLHNTSNEYNTKTHKEQTRLSQMM